MRLRSEGARAWKLDVPSFLRAAELAVGDDGVTFDVESLAVGREEQEYGGVRVEVRARVAKAEIPLQVGTSGSATGSRPARRSSRFRHCSTSPHRACARIRAGPSW